ncbi:CSN8/SAC3 domain-containing protein [Kitasatospora mediocidica]|uniref:hypothetical protein n=1 Tax=Kitasatospora mediocidica TaxID=58352 RepID=UPI00068F1456|nr:hypothetical protein [Kitasatospora mediocidica]
MLTFPVIVLVACGTSGGKPVAPAAASSASATVAAPSSSAAGPATVTVTAAQPSATVTVTPTATSTVIPTPTVPDSASAVVGAYFAAINSHDYATAWSLGGENLSPSYSAFVAGFADTVRDDVQIVGVSGSAVSVRLTATLASGGTQVYAGTYDVGNGVITSASVTAVATPSRSETGVRAGEFCSHLGATTTAVDGKSVVCSTTSTDPEPRWRSR